MIFKNTSERYGALAILLHWLMAILIIGMLILGLYMDSLPTSMKRLQLIGIHKEIGALILFLVLLRLLWKLKNLSPLLPVHMPVWQKLAARGSHLLLYVLMFLMPITGWLMSNAAGLPVSFFGLFTLPVLISANPALSNLFFNFHQLLAYSLMGLIGLHVLAALQHHFLLKDKILRRMLPW